ncbi:hypothetical protein [Arthrobacter sp.]|uniref:hypothetical protein n=1 Tax=Arthrobacter sp. TaxID=1667 RepID=UPI003A9123E4
MTTSLHGWTVVVLGRWRGRTRGVPLLPSGGAIIPVASRARTTGAGLRPRWTSSRGATRADVVVVTLPHTPATERSG